MVGVSRDDAFSWIRAASAGGMLALGLAAASPLLAAPAARAAASPAAAADWTQSFVPAATASYLRASDKMVLVAAAGKATGPLQQATAAFAAALRAAGGGRTVMTAEALGDLATATDKEVADLASKMPVNVIAIVRVFDGTPPTAVVALMDRSGVARPGFAAQLGSPLAAAEAHTPGEGSAASAAETVTRVGPQEPSAEAKQKYRENRVGFVGWAAVSSRGAVLSTWSQPYRGHENQQLSMPEFYDLVGRPDLASSYKTRMWIRTGLYVSGLSMALAGALLWVKAPSEIDCLSDWNLAESERAAAEASCKEAARNSNQGAIGIGLMGAGAVTATIGAFVDANPVSGAEAADLAREHNRKLKKELGLPADHSRAPGRPAMDWYLRVGARGAGATGLTLGARF